MTSTRALGDITNIKLGQNPPVDSISDVARGVPLLRRPSDFGVIRARTTEWTERPAQLARAGDLLISLRGANLGAVNRADRDYAIGRGIAAITLGHELADQAFLLYAVQQRRPELRALATGSAVPNISVKDVESLAVPWPAPPERHALATALIALDLKIERNEATAQHLSEFAHALFDGAVVEPALADDQRPGWLRVRIADIAEELSEQTDPGRVPDELFEYYNLAAHGAGRIPNVVPGQEIRSPKKRVPVDAILFALLNPEDNKVWRARPSGDAIPVASTEFMVLVAKDPTDQAVLEAYFRFDPDLREQILASINTGAAGRPRARAAAVRDATITWLPAEARRELANKLAPTLELEDRLLRENHALQQLKDAVQPELLEARRPAPDLGSELTESLLREWAVPESTDTNDEHPRSA
jgi:hypothetical protein